MSNKGLLVSGAFLTRIMVTTANTSDGCKDELLGNPDEYLAKLKKE